MSRVVLDARVVTGSGGGPDKTILNSPRFLTKLGYEMPCVYLHPPNDPGFDTLRRQAAATGAELISVADRGPLDLRVIRQCLTICRERNVSVWHGHDYKTNALGLLLARFHPMRLVTTLHGWVEKTARTPLYFQIDRLTLRFYERVYCVSRDLSDAAKRAGVPARKRVLLENGIDLADYRPGQLDRAEARVAFGLPASAPVVLGVGRLSPEKAFDALIRALPELPGVHALIVGEGGDRARLEALAAELNVRGRVHLPGWSRDARRAFAAADVFALPSLREGLPNVLLEAMALGVPAVASRIAGIPRVVTDGVDGFLIPPGDSGALAGQLEPLLADPELRTRVAAAARATVESRYSFADRMARLAESYDRLLARPGWGVC